MARNIEIYIDYAQLEGRRHIKLSRRLWTAEVHANSSNATVNGRSSAPALEITRTKIRMIYTHTKSSEAILLRDDFRATVEIAKSFCKSSFSLPLPDEYARA